MVLKLADRVLEATTTTGTVSFSLAGAVTGYATFSSSIGNGNTCYYAAVHSDLGSHAEWEIGIGTVGGGSLSRQVISSSNSGQLVDFSSGTKHVFVTIPAIRALIYDDDGRVFIGPSGEAGVFNTSELLHVKGEVSASGINLDESVFLSSNAAAPSDTTARLYNVGGSLYWAGNNISTSEGQQLFSVMAGASGTTETTYSNFPVMMGSGIIFKGGEGISITIDHPDDAPGQGSGILTFNADSANTVIRISAPSGTEGGGSQKQYELSHGSGLIFEAERGITIELNNNANLGQDAASGVLTFRGPDLSSYIGAVASGIELQNNTAVATTGNTLQRGIVQLTNEITDSSGLALTPRAVYDANYITQSDIIFNVGATNAAGSGITISRAPSGLFFKAGSNIGLSLEDGATNSHGLDGSGVLVISSTNSDTTYGAASGLVMDGDNIIRHEASAASSVNNSSPFFIQDINIDSFGHITSINSASVTTSDLATRLSLASSGAQPDVNLSDGSGIIFIGGGGISVTVEDGSNHSTSPQHPGSGLVTIEHSDTSSQASVNNAGNTFIQDITLDEFGHITALTSASVSASATNVNTDGTPTAVASGGIPIFQDGDSIHFDPKLTWSSGDIDLTQGVLGVEGYFNLAQVSAPSTTTDKLYNVGGNLIWNGTNISAGIGGGAITSDGPNSPQASGIPFFSSSDEVGYDDRLVFASGSATSAKFGITTGSGKENNFPHSTLHADGSFATRITSVTGINDEARDTDSIIALDNNHINGTMNFYLPEAKTCQGRVYTLIRNSSHGSGIFIYGSGTDKIDNETSEGLWIDGDSLTVVACSGLQSDSDFGWRSLNKNYTPHTVRFQLSPTESGNEPIADANRLMDNSISSFEGRFPVGIVDYTWYMSQQMTFEGTQWAFPGVAASGNFIGSYVPSFQGASGAISNYTALRDGLYDVSFHLESLNTYSKGRHNVEFIMLRFPYDIVKDLGYEGNETSNLIRLHLINILSGNNPAHQNREGPLSQLPGDSNSISSYFTLDAQDQTSGLDGISTTVSDKMKLKKDDRLLFFIRPRRLQGTSLLDPTTNPGMEFPDTLTFKALGRYTHVTVTEIR